MKKNYTFNPLVHPAVLLSGDDVVIGGGTGQGGLAPRPISYPIG